MRNFLAGILFSVFLFVACEQNSAPLAPTLVHTHTHSDTADGVIAALQNHIRPHKDGENLHSISDVDRWVLRVKRHIGWQQFAGYDLTFIQYVGYLQSELTDLRNELTSIHNNQHVINLDEYCSPSEIANLVYYNHGPSNYYGIEYVGNPREIKPDDNLKYSELNLRNAYRLSVEDVNLNRTCKLKGE